MCILMYPVASEMMKEHIAYFHYNELGNIHSDPAPLPGEFLPRWRNEATSDFRPPRHKLKNNPPQKAQ